LLIVQRKERTKLKKLRFATNKIQLKIILPKILRRINLNVKKRRRKNLRIRLRSLKRRKFLHLSVINLRLLPPLHKIFRILLKLPTKNQIPQPWLKIAFQTLKNCRKTHQATLSLQNLQFPKLYQSQSLLSTQNSQILLSQPLQNSKNQFPQFSSELDMSLFQARTFIFQET